MSNVVNVNASLERVHPSNKHVMSQTINQKCIAINEITIAYIQEIELELTDITSETYLKQGEE